MRFLFFGFFALIVHSGFGQNKVSFKLKKTPKEIGTYTTKYFWGTTTTESARSLGYNEFRDPLVIRLFEDSTAILFYSRLKGDTLRKAFGYYSPEGQVYRGRAKISASKLILNLRRKDRFFTITLNYSEHQLDTNLVKKPFVYHTFNGEMVEEFNGVKPWLIDAESKDKRIELFLMKDFYFIEQLSNELQDSLKTKLEDKILKPLQN